MIEPRSRGVLDRPVKPGDDGGGLFDNRIQIASERSTPRPAHSTGITSTSTLSFCLREPTMMPSTGETSEKSRPVARMM